MTITVERFRQGMTPQQYVDQMKTNRDVFQKVLASVKASPDDESYFSALPEPLCVAVFTEDWCGDSLTCTPALFQLAKDTGNLEVRVFLRDQNTELAQAHLPQHRWGTVPVFVFFNPNMQEISRFIETAPGMVPILDELEVNSLREVGVNPDTTKSQGELDEGTRNLVRKKRIEARITRAREWGQIVVRSIRQVVSDGLAREPDQRPAEGGTQFPPP